MPIGRLNQAVISLAALFEEVATYQALAILCPEGALEKLRLGVSEGRYSQQDVSAILDVPEEHARLVMTDMWQPFIETLKAASI